MVTFVTGQALQFVNVPGTVNEGSDNVLITWTGGDGVTPVQITLVQDNRVIDQIEDDDDNAAQTFEWDVELESDIGGYYSLRLIQGARTVDSSPINIIDDLGRSAAASSPGTPTTQGTTLTSSTPNTAPPSSLTADIAATASSGSTSITAAAATLVTTTLPGETQAATITLSDSTGGNNSATQVPDSSTPGEPRTNNSSRGTLSGGTIAGIVIGALAVITIAGFLIWLYRRRMRKANKAHRSPASYNSDAPLEKIRGNGFVFPSTFAASGTNAADSTSTERGELHSDEKHHSADHGLRRHQTPDPVVHEMYSPYSSIDRSGKSVGESGSGLYEMRPPDNRHEMPPTGRENIHDHSSETIGSLQAGHSVSRHNA